MEKLKIFKKKFIQLLSVFMSFLLFISSYTYSVTAKDFNGNWANQYIESLIEQGIYEGSIDSYDSKREITQTEFAEMASKIFHYNKSVQVQSQDVTLEEWFSENIADIAGQKQKISNQSLTRQDGAVIIAKMLKYSSSNSEKSKFTDDNKISDYARASINTLAEKGYLKGYLDGTFKPEKYLTLGEAASLLCTVAGKVYSKNGIYDLNNQVINSNLSIVSPGVVLKNAVIEGDLYISEGVGTGEVTLDNVIVKGETIVAGGGMNSVIFIDTQLGSLRVEVPDGVPVRIVASGDTNINMTEVHSESKLQTDNLTGDGFQGIVIAMPANSKISLDGDFPSIVVDSPKAKVDILGGKTDNIKISENAEGAKINIASKATVNSMNANAESTIGGTGKIEKVSITAPNVSIAQNPDIVEVGDKVTANVNNNTLDSGVHTNTSTGSSSSSGGGGSSSGQNKKELLCSYKEISQTEDSIFVNMFFDEPIEFILNGKALTGNELNNLFIYKNENKTEAIKNVSISEDKKYIAFYIPKIGKSNTYQIYLDDKIQKQNWALRGITSKKEFSKKSLFLSFKISDFSNPPFIVNGPEDITVFAGDKAIFKANTEINTELELNYQWYRNGEIIPGATKDTYSLITGLSDTKSKFSVKAWITSSDNVRETITSKTAVLTVRSKSEIPKSKVILEKDSEGIAGDKCITGLEKGQRYYIIVDKENKTYPIMKDGTLGSEITEIIYDNLEPLETTTISNLINNEKYKVVKVLSSALLCSYKEISQTSAGIFVDMAFDEPVEFLVNGKNISDNVLKNSFIYKTGELNGLIDTIAISDDKKIITFYIPKKGNLNTYEISLSDEAKKNKWVLKGTNTNNEYKQMMDIFLNFTINDFSNPPFIVNGPEDITVFAGDKAVFKANVQNNASKELEYQWYRDGNPIADETKDTYSFTTGLSDSGSKFSVKVWIKNSDNTREPIISKTAFLTVQSQNTDPEKPSRVILEDGSEGIAGDKCITGLEKGQRYYIIVYKENKTYSIMKDGTLGSEITEIIYDNLEPLETTSISNLTNEEKYMVIKAEEPELTVILEEGSEGTAGNECIIGLEEGQRYYIIVYKENKIYSIMKDGTLGSEITEIIYDSLEPLETTSISNLTNNEKYKVVKVLEPEEPELTVILEEGSEGIAGNECITGLKEGYRYYIIVYKENKSYPIMKDGTLGSSDTEILYKNLEPLETTVISNLINEEKYMVVKVLPNTPVLQSLSVYGFTNNLNFYGYVPKAVDGEIPLTNSSLELKMKPDSDDAIVTVTYRIGENGQEQEAYYNEDYYNIYFDQYASDIRITVTVSPKVEKENQSVYKINVTRNTNIIITSSGSNIEQTGNEYLYVSNVLNKEYHIKYMKPTETFEGITCKKNGSLIEFNENKQYTKKVLNNNIISIKLTNRFTTTLVENDKLEFTFKFSGGTTAEKVCGFTLYGNPPVMGCNIEFGEPELISGNSWLNIFVPITTDETDDNLSKNIRSITTYLYEDDQWHYSTSTGLSIYEKDGKKGIFTEISLSSHYKAYKKYRVEIEYYELSEGETDIEINKKTFSSKICNIPVGEEVKGTVVFSKKDDPSVSLIPVQTSEPNKFTLNLTNDNTPFTHKFQKEQESDKTFIKSSEPGLVTVTDNSNKQVELYITSETEPELMYIAANMNSIPKLFLYDYEGEAVVKDGFITNYNMYLRQYSNLGYNFYFNYYMGDKSFGTVKDLKEKHLNIDDIRLSIGIKEDGAPLEKTMKEFLDEGYFSGTDETTYIGDLHFKNVKELFAAFNFNPLKDTITEAKSSVKLNGSVSQFKLDDSIRQFGDNNGTLNEIIIKDKNSEEFITCDPATENIVIPYAEAAIVTKSTGSYECVIFDEDAIPIDDKGLIMTPNVETPIAVVIAKGVEIPKIYKFKLTYEPQASTFSMINNDADISFIKLTDDMSKEEIESILKSVENEFVHQDDKLIEEDSKDILEEKSDEVSSETPSEDTSEDTSEDSDVTTSETPSEDTSEDSDVNVNETPSENTNEDSNVNVNETPSEDTSKDSDINVNETPSENTSEDSDINVNETPSEDTSKDSDINVNETPSKDTNEDSNVNVNETPSKNTNEDSNVNVNETSSESTNEVNDITSNGNINKASDNEIL